MLPNRSRFPSKFVSFGFESLLVDFGLHVVNMSLETFNMEVVKAFEADDGFRLIAVKVVQAHGTVA